MSGPLPIGHIPAGFPDLARISGGPGSSAQPGGSFGSVLREAIAQVNDLQNQSGKEIENFLTGEGEDLHKTVLAVQKADLAFQMMLAVRNKVVDAYQEIMRIQL